MTSAIQRDRIARLGSETECPGCDNGPCRFRWVLAMGFANDPKGATVALIRAHEPKSTPGERAAARRAYDAQPPILKALCEKIKAECKGERIPELAQISVDAREYFQRTQTGGAHGTERRRARATEAV